MLLPHMAARLFGVPLAIHRPKLDIILSVLGTRVGLADLAAPTGFTPPARTPTPAHDKIAVIPVHGTLLRRTSGLDAESGLASYAAIGAQLDAALAHPDVAAILLDIDSPGGESSGVFDLAERIRAACAIKPVWAVANEMAFSAAYALAAASSRVFVSRTGGVGSIGVIAMHIDQSIKDAKDGVRYTAVYAGARKNDLNPHAPLSDQAHAVLQSEVQRIYEVFVDTVARHRGLDAEAVRATEAGLFFGADALAAGLADSVGSFDEAFAQLSHALSPRPTTLAAATRTGLLHPQPMEPFMTDPTEPAGAEAPLADPTATASPPPTSPPALSVADALEIAQTCTLAGRADLIAGFLESAATPHAVRHQLLAAQADASPEIVSRIAPEATRPAASNPLIDAAQRIAAAATSKKES